MPEELFPEAKRGIGIHLAGERPTTEEVAQLSEMAAEAKLGPYVTKLIVAWDAVRNERTVRLDALP